MRTNTLAATHEIASFASEKGWLRFDGDIGRSVAMLLRT